MLSETDQTAQSLDAVTKQLFLQFLSRQSCPSWLPDLRDGFNDKHDTSAAPRWDFFYKKELDSCWHVNSEFFKLYVLTLLIMTRNSQSSSHLLFYRCHRYFYFYFSTIAFKATRFSRMYPLHGRSSLIWKLTSWANLTYESCTVYPIFIYLKLQVFPAAGGQVIC